MSDHADFQPVADADAIKPGQMMRVDVAGHRLLLANVEGEVFAVDDTCSHEDSSLYLGCLKGYHIKCSLHGSRFDLRTGQPMEEPADEPIATYAVRITDGRIEVAA
jgi:3-phenylpropionate/trans-cinnamate dioxygenase ferredoxin subunit